MLVKGTLTDSAFHANECTAFHTKNRDKSRLFSVDTHYLIRYLSPIKNFTYNDTNL